MNVPADFLRRLEELTKEAGNHNIYVHGVLCCLMGCIVSEREDNMLSALAGFSQDEISRLNALRRLN